MFIIYLFIYSPYKEKALTLRNVYNLFIYSPYKEKALTLRNVYNLFIYLFTVLTRRRL